MPSNLKQTRLARKGGCPPQPELHERPLIAPPLAAELADLFKVLANDTRLSMLHALARDGELCVTEIGERLGMKPQAISNQLQRLTASRVLASRREGNNIYYRIVYPCVTTLLHQALCLVENAE